MPVGKIDSICVRCVYLFTFPLLISYRDWFVPQKSEVDALRWELMTERRLRRQAEERLALAEQARRVAERERDLFRVSLIHRTV